MRPAAKLATQRRLGGDAVAQSAHDARHCFALLWRASRLTKALQEFIARRRQKRLLELVGKLEGDFIV